jgi:hypothetical protein
MEKYDSNTLLPHIFGDVGVEGCGVGCSNKFLAMVDCGVSELIAWNLVHGTGLMDRIMFEGLKNSRAVCPYPVNNLLIGWDMGYISRKHRKI